MGYYAARDDGEGGLIKRSVAGGLVACAIAFAGCGDDGGAGDPQGGAAPEQAQVRQWPAKWCQAEPGMTRQQMRDLMGEPTEEYTPENTPEGFDPQMIWEAFEYHFTAYFNVDDRVRQLDVNDLDLTAAQKSEIRCEFIRVAE